MIGLGSILLTSPFTPRKRLPVRAAAGQPPVAQPVGGLGATSPGLSAAHLSPRDQAEAEIRAILAKGQHALIAGPAGMGKSRLLGQIAQAHPHAFYLPASGAKKAILFTLAERLFDDGRLGEAYAYFADFADVRKKLGRLTLPELMAVVTEAAAGGDYLLAIDHAETLTERTVKDIVLPLSRVCTLLLAVDTPVTPARERNLRPVADRCRRFELPPLTDDELRSLLWQTLDRTNHRHWQVIEAKVLDTAGGRPGVVVDLARQLAGSGGSLREIRSLQHSAHADRRVSLLVPFLLIVITTVVTSRYLARGFDDPSFYLLALLGYGFVLVLRPLLYKRRSK